jgi:hypothetical protein
MLSDAPESYAITLYRCSLVIRTPATHKRNYDTLKTYSSYVLFFISIQQYASLFYGEVKAV